MYDSHILDMVELGIERYRGLKEFKTQKVSLGIKPCLLFAGELFEHNHEYRRIKNMLVDMFQREKIQAVRLQGLEHALLFTAAENQIYFRSYRYDSSSLHDYHYQMGQSPILLVCCNLLVNPCNQWLPGTCQVVHTLLIHGIKALYYSE